MRGHNVTDVLKDESVTLGSDTGTVFLRYAHRSEKLELGLSRGNVATGDPEVLIELTGRQQAEIIDFIRILGCCDAELPGAVD